MAVIAASVLLSVAAVATSLSLLRILGPSPPPEGPPRAAIIDQLSLTVPNPDFAEAATRLLEQAGYAVEYYDGGKVTVNFYKDIPSRGFQLLLFRVHSGVSREVNLATGEVSQMEFVSLFTGEIFRQTLYLKEQQEQLVGAGRTPYDPDTTYFGIGPRFIKQSMRGEFKDSVIVLMGCDSLKTPTTAQALIDKGASAVVGWNKKVAAEHTDAATLQLLEEYVVKGLPLDEAVKNVSSLIGPDPYFGAEMLLLRDSARAVALHGQK